MALYYKLYQSNREGDNKGKWYGRAMMTDVIGIDQLADRVQRNCTAKKSDVLAVITELVEVMQDELQASHRVKLDGFGSFKLGINTSPAEKASDFSVSKNVKGVHVIFMPEVKVSADGSRQKTFLSGCTVQEAPKYDVDKEEG